MNWNNACENTAKCLSMLIENSIYAQREMRDLGMSEKGFLKEACTIKLTSSRRCGHTTAIAKVIPEYFNKAILLTHRMEMAMRLNNCVVEELKREKETLLDRVTMNYVGTKDGREYHFAGYSHNGFLSALRGHSCEAVVVDCASMLSQKKSEELFDVMVPSMAHNKYKFFIFIE